MKPTREQHEQAFERLADKVMRADPAKLPPRETVKRKKKASPVKARPKG